MSDEYEFDQAMTADRIEKELAAEAMRLSLWRGHLTGPAVSRVVWVRADDEDHAASQIWSWWLEQPQPAHGNVPSMPTVLLDVRRVA